MTAPEAMTVMMLQGLDSETGGGNISIAAARDLRSEVLRYILLNLIGPIDQNSLN